MAVRIICGDALATLRTLPSASVHACITSPPYFALRDYGTGTWQGGDAGCDHKGGAFCSDKSTLAGYTSETVKLRTGGVPFRATCGKCGAVRVDQQMGMEPTVAEYVAALVGVFREVRRVLRPDGSLFVNLGDSYNAGTSAKRKAPKTTVDVGGWKDAEIDGGARINFPGVPAKSLGLIPQRVAIALSDDGWIIRSVFPWVKRSCLPESCRDRATNATEYVIHAVQRGKYFWDAVAVQRGNANPDLTECMKHWSERPNNGEWPSGSGGRMGSVKNGRNFRNTDLFFDSLEPPYGVISDRDGTLLALDVNPEPLREAHYAAFPSKLVSPLIRAATSERGCCAACGAQWARVVERQKPPRDVYTKRSAPSDGFIYGTVAHGELVGHGEKLQNWLNAHPPQTTGWSPSCQCHGHFEDRQGPKDWISDETGVRQVVRVWVPDGDTPPPVPCTVLDPFSGAGTTALVAHRLGRDAIGIELSADYVAMSRARIEADAGMFADIEDAAPAPQRQDQPDMLAVLP